MTPSAGLRELDYRAQHPELEPPVRLRQPGGGRKALLASDPELLAALEALVEPLMRGDPESPLRWTCKSTRQLAAELSWQRHPIGYRTVAWLLHEAGYSLLANRKTHEGSQHPDRNAQFEYINARAQRFQKRRQPVISVDTKKKELVGDFKNGGQEWRPQGDPEKVRVHDFVDKKLGKAIPYGVYDVTHNQGWVSVGINHDTAYFATASVRRWWEEMSVARFPRARELLITADGGGSNSARSRLWKVALQELADAIGLQLSVCHFPPGTSKWNKVEHRLFCFITNNWRGKPLVSHQAIVNLIAATTTTKGLTVKAALDETHYETGLKVTDAQLATLKIYRLPSVSQTQMAGGAGHIWGSEQKEARCLGPNSQGNGPSVATGSSGHAIGSAGGHVGKQLSDADQRCQDAAHQHTWRALYGNAHRQAPSAAFRGSLGRTHIWHRTCLFLTYLWTP